MIYTCYDTNTNVKQRSMQMKKGTVRISSCPKHTTPFFLQEQQERLWKRDAFERMSLQEEHILKTNKNNLDQQHSCRVSAQARAAGSSIIPSQKARGTPTIAGRSRQ